MLQFTDATRILTIDNNNDLEETLPCNRARNPVSYVEISDQNRFPIFLFAGGPFAPKTIVLPKHFSTEPIT